MFRAIRFFLQQGWKYSKRYVLWLVLGELVASLIPISAALIPKYMIDELLGLQRPQRLILYVCIFAGYALLAGALNTFFVRDGFTRRCEVGRQIDLKISRKLIETDFCNIESPHFKNMHEKAQKFLTCDWHGFGYLLDCAVRIIGQAITLLGLAAILSSLSVGYVMLFIVLTFISAWVENRARQRAMALSRDVVQEQRGMMYYDGLFQEARFGKEVRLNRLSNWFLTKYDAFYRNVVRNQHQQNIRFIQSGVIRAALTFCQQAAAYGILIVKVLNGDMTVGDFTMCISAVMTFAEALRVMMDSVAEIRTYDKYYDDLDQYLNLADTMRKPGGKPVAASTHRIELKNVSFKYPGSESWALRHVNLTLEAGKTLSLVGENGSGKSTLIKLLIRLYDPTEGTICMDGMDIREYDYDAYLAQFAAVFQDLQLFDMPLRENIAFDEADDERIMAVLRQVGLKEKVETLPNGLDTFVGRVFDEQGFEPSGGEAQKIGLARALYRNAPVVLLDEPTAAMDARAEYELYRSFDSLVHGKTAVYISHRMSSSRFCDHVAVLAHGELIEYGTHSELMEKHGKYAELYDLQAQYYVD